MWARSAHSAGTGKTSDWLTLILPAYGRRVCGRRSGAQADQSRRAGPWALHPGPEPTENKRMRLLRPLLPLALALAAVTSAQAWPWDHRDDGPKIPRWAALKFGEVNARAGPGEDTRVVFVYRAR